MPYKAGTASVISRSYAVLKSVSSGEGVRNIFAGPTEVHHGIQIAQAWVPSASRSILCNREALNERPIVQLPDIPASDLRGQQQLPQKMHPSAVPTEAEDLEPGLQQQHSRSQGSSGQKAMCRNESSCKKGLGFFTPEILLLIKTS